MYRFIIGVGVFGFHFLLLSYLPLYNVYLKLIVKNNNKLSMQKYFSKWFKDHDNLE